MEQCVSNALAFIKKDSKMVDYIKNFNDPRGFASTQHPMIDLIDNAVIADGHSGASFAICLRMCQRNLKNDESKKG